MPYRWMVLLVAAAIALGAIYAWSTSGPTPTPITGVPDPASTEVGEALSDRASGDGRRAVEFAAELPAANQGAKGAEPHALEVHVVDGRTNADVPDAEVFGLTDGGYLGFAALDEPERFPRVTARTDSAGIAQLRTTELRHVLVRTRSHYGRASVKNEDESIEVRVHPIGALHVRVLDAAGGSAVGVRVKAEVQPLNGKALWSPGGRSDATGTWHWQEFGIAAAAATPDSKVLITCHGPGIDVRKTLDSLPALNSTLEVQLVPTGRIVVHLEDSNGRPLPGAWTVQAHMKAVDPVTGKDLAKGWQLESVTAGIAEFAHVALDAEFGVRVPFSSAPELTVTGPTAAMPVVEAHLRVGETSPVLLGRALDSHGATLLDGQVRATIDSNEVWGSGKLDAHGRFAIILPADDERGVQTITLTYNSKQPKLERELTPRQLPNGPTDLGDVTFRTPEVLVAGRVLPAAGAPCNGFHLVIQERAAGEKAWSTTRIRATIDGAAFWFHGSADPTREHRLIVAPEARCHVPPDPIPFEPGQTDLEIRLERGHTLELTILAPGHFGWAETHGALQLRPIAGPAFDRLHDRNAGIQRSGEYRHREPGVRVAYWNGLVTGTYALTAEMLRAPIIEPQPIDIPGPAGGMATATLDLRSVLTEFTIRTFASDGTPIRPLLTLIRDGAQLGFGHGGIAIEAADQSLRGVVVAGTLDFALIAEDHQPTVLRAFQGGEHTLQLDRADSTLRVHVDPAPPAGAVLIAAPADVAANWAARGLRVVDAKHAFRNLVNHFAPTVTATLDATGDATLQLRTVGRHTLRVVSATGESLGELDPSLVDAQAGATQRVRLRLRR